MSWQKLIAAKLDNDSSMVVVTEMLRTIPYDRPGKWGVNEPDPTIASIVTWSAARAELWRYANLPLSAKPI